LVTLHVVLQFVFSAITLICHTYVVVIYDDASFSQEAVSCCPNGHMKFMVPLDEKFVVCFAGQLDDYACFFSQSEG
jgi:hypothetical protein